MSKIVVVAKLAFTLSNQMGKNVFKRVRLKLNLRFINFWILPEKNIPNNYLIRTNFCAEKIWRNWRNPRQI